MWKIKWNKKKNKKNSNRNNNNITVNGANKMKIYSCDFVREADEPKKQKFWCLSFFSPMCTEFCRFSLHTAIEQC